MNEIETLNQIKKAGVVAVLRNVPFNKIEFLADSLIEGGISALEVTIGSENVYESISILSKKFGNDAIIGAGTVIDEVAATRALEQGAAFLLSPSLHKPVIETAARYGKLAIPGVMTPTEIITALEWGANVIKVFPAGVLGHDYIKNVLGPFPTAKIIPTGGINLNNAGDFIKSGAIALGVGGNLVNLNAIADGDCETITKMAKEYIEQVRLARQTDLR